MNDQPPRRRGSTLWVRAALSCAVLVWILHATPLRTIAATLRHTDLWLLFVGLLLSLVARLAAAERTLAVSRALRLPLSRGQTITTLFISNFYSLVSPGPVLSGVVTVYRYRNFGASIKGSVASLLGSRAIECAAFVVGGALGLLLDARAADAPLRARLLIAASILLGAGIVMLACGWLIGRGLPTPASAEPSSSARAVSGRIFGLPLADICRELFDCARRASLQAALPATAQILLSATALFVFAAAVGVELSLVSALWVSAVVYIAVLLPISIIGLGVREVALIECLGVLGITANAAVAISVLLFLDPLLNALIGGVLQAGSLRMTTVTQ